MGTRKVEHRHVSTQKGMDDWMVKWQKSHPVLLVGDKENKAYTISYHENRGEALNWVRENPYVKWEYSNMRIVNRNKSIFYI